MQRDSYKWRAQVEAERLADRRGLDYDRLDAERREELYCAGLNAVVEEMVDAGDRRRKEGREDA